MNLIPKYQNGINTLADQIRANPFGSRDAFAESVDNSLQNSLQRVKIKRYTDTITSNRNSEVLDKDNLNRAIEQGAELGLSPEQVVTDYQTQSPAIESIHPEMLFTGAGLKAAGAAGKSVMRGAKAIGNWFESKLPGIGKAVTAATGVEGTRHYLSSEGGAKTFNKLYQGDWSGAAKSGFGDALDLTGMGIASKMFTLAKNSGLPFWKAASSAEVSTANIFRSEPIPASAQSSATPKSNWDFGKIGDRFYLKNGNWDTAAAIEDIKQGKKDWKDWITSDIYKKAAQDNKQEALARGEHYTPIHERPEFNDALDTGVKLTFDAKGPNGEYAYGSPIVNVNLAGSEKASSTAYHELTHAAGIGTPSREAMSKAGAGNMEQAQKELAYLRFKAGQVFKPGSEYGGKFELDRHAMEAAANAREFGYQLGLKVGEPYPGYEKAMEIINSYPNQGNKAGLKELFQLDEKNLPYVWKALTGVQFGMIPIGLNIFNTTPTNNQ